MLPSEDPMADGVDNIIYAESLHYNEGRYLCELNLECPTDSSNTVTVTSQNENDEEYSFVHHGCVCSMHTLKRSRS